VKVDDTIYVSGQLSHDDQRNIVGQAPLDDSGRIRDYSNMEAQMRQTYANAKKILSQFGATLDDVVEEVLYVTDMDTAFYGYGVRRSWPSSQGNVWVKAGGGKHDTRHTPAGAARAAD